MDQVQGSARKRPIVIKYTLITAAMLIVYFLILIYSGLMKYSGLRMINYLLIGIGLFLALREVQRKNQSHIVTFLGGLGMGFMIILITDIIFSFFIMAFGFIQPSFISYVWKNPFYHNEAANAMAMSAYIFSETLFLGIVLDLIIMTAFKRGDPAPEELSE